jgi:hypothetical protein
VAALVRALALHPHADSLPVPEKVRVAGADLRQSSRTCVRASANPTSTGPRFTTVTVAALT